MNCDLAQPRLLDHLFGLLDDSEQQELQAHLAGCPACQAALDQAKQQQLVLGIAAKGDFSQVRFEPLVVPLRNPATEPTLQLTRPAARRRRPHWGRWAVAAAVLLAVGAGAALVAAPWVRHAHEVADAERRQREARAERSRIDADEAARQARADAELREVQEQIKLLRDRWERETNKDMEISVTGPDDLQAGAPATYTIETHRIARGGVEPRFKQAPARVGVQVIDGKSNKTLYGPKKLESDGKVELQLPGDLAVTPNAELLLQVTAENPDGKKAEVTEKLRLTGPRFLTHLATDRPLYRPGDTVRARSLTLERVSLTPPKDELELRFRLTDGQGRKLAEHVGNARLRLDEKAKELLKGADGKVLNGYGVADFALPDELSEGVYTLTISEERNRFPAEKRTFLVRRFQAPRLNKEVEYHRASYGPGDLVQANCVVRRVEGGNAVAGQPVAASARVDGQEVKVENADKLKTDAAGRVTVKFRLPEKMDTGRGSLSVVFHDGQIIETIDRPLPIVLDRLHVEFFPEGGDLVAGAANRVYFQARTTLGRPAELRGQIIDLGSNILTGLTGRESVAAAQTLSDDKAPGVNQGLGAFSFTPRAGHVYALKIDSPQGMPGFYPLPVVRPEGVVLHIARGVVTDGIEVKVYNGGRPRNLLVGAYCRGRLMHQQTVDCPADAERAVALRPPVGVGGVFRVTVFEMLPNRVMKPLAERLIYRPARERVAFNVSTDRKQYAPGEKVTVRVGAEDEQKKPAAVVAMLAVVDQSVLKLADEKTYRSLPTHFYLTTEVGKADDLEHADFLLTDHPKAAQALDLLLGTQGWRRFAEQPQDVEQQKELWIKHKADAERLLFATAVTTRQGEGENLQNLAAAIGEDAAKLKVKQVQVVADREDREHKADIERRRLQTSQAEAERDARGAEAALAAYRDRVLRIGGTLAALGLLLLGIAGIVVGAVRSTRHEKEGRLALVAGFSAFVLLVVGGVAVVLYLGDQKDGASRPFESAASAPKDGGMGLEKEEKARDRDKDGGKDAPKAEPRELFFAGDMVRARAWQERELVDQLRDAAEQRRFENGPMLLRLKDKEAKLEVAIAGLEKLVEEQKLVKRLEKVAFNLKAAQEPAGDKEDKQGQAARPVPPKDDPPGKFGKKGIRAEDGERLALGARIQQLDRLLKQKRPDMEEKPQMIKDLVQEFLEADVKGRRAILREMDRIDADGLVLLAKKLRELTYEPWVVRQYAHKHTAAADGLRTDFTDTVCWQPVLLLPAGKTTEVSFDLNDSVTSFQVLVAGCTADGRLGSATKEFASKLPFSLHPKLPHEISSTDKLTVPLTIANDTDQPRQVTVTLKADNLRVAGAAEVQRKAAGQSRTRTLFELTPATVDGFATLSFLGRGDPFGVDGIQKKIRIVPDGYPTEKSLSDVLTGNVVNTVTLPQRRDQWVAGTLKLQAQVFPSTLSELQQGLEGMLREPYGCFEQTSSSNYPNTLILSYLKEHGQVQPQIEQRATDLLTRGYARLIGFECNNPNRQEGPPKWGYEWFGGNAPPHEALTAYGLLEFNDMAKVFPVDREMVERTKQYLLSRRDGKGGFLRNQRALDGFGGAPPEITNAYILWALTDAGAAGEVRRELDAQHAAAKASKDPYFVALVGLSLLNAGRTDDAVALLRQVVLAQDKTGYVGGATTSITRSGGQNLHLETTALALLGWQKANRPGEFQAAIQKALRWIGQQRNGGGSFGTTQATVLSLKALIAHARDSKRMAKDGEVRLYVGTAKDPALVQKFTAGQQGAITLALPDVEKVLQPGDNPVRLELTNGNVLPYTLAWSYRTVTPAAHPDAPLSLATKLDRTAAKEGDTLRLTVELKSVKKAEGMAVAVVGLPAGLMLPDNLEELKQLVKLRDNDKKPGDVDHFEVQGRELILYWRQAPAARTVTLSLICQNPGTFRGPASRAYLYYQPERKTWVEPLGVTVTPAAE